MKKIINIVMITSLFIAAPASLLGMEEHSKAQIKSLPVQESHRTPFIMAAYMNDWDAAARFLATRTVNVNEVDYLGNTALHYVLLYGAACAETLLNAGANPNTLNKDGLSPLMIAVMNQYTKIVPLCLAHGGNPNLRHPACNNFTPYEVALNIKKLIESQQKSSSEQVERSKQVVAAIIRPSHDNNLSNAAQSSFAAAQASNTEIKDHKSQLAQQSPSAFSENGKQAEEKIYGPFAGSDATYTRSQLITAISNKKLIPNDMYTENDGTIPPIITAAVNDHLDVIKCLFDNGLKYIDETDDCKETALHKAAISGNYDMAEFLIEQRIALNEQNDKKESALFYAIRTGNSRIVALLINNGAKLSIANQDTLTPRNVAKGCQSMLSKQERIGPKGTAFAEIVAILETRNEELKRLATKRSEEAFAQLEAEENATLENKAQAQIVHDNARLAQRNAAALIQKLGGLNAFMGTKLKLHDLKIIKLVNGYVFTEAQLRVAKGATMKRSRMLKSREENVPATLILSAEKAKIRALQRQQQKQRKTLTASAK